MTFAALVALLNFFGPVVLERLVADLPQRQWTSELVAQIARDRDLKLTTAEKKALVKELSTNGWDALLSAVQGDPKPLQQLATRAVPSGASPEILANSLLANAASALTPQDLASWLDVRLAELAKRSEAPLGIGPIAEQLGDDDYCEMVAASCRTFRWRARLAAGLNPEQAAATIAIGDPSTTSLSSVAAGRVAFVVAPVGSGKSDLVLTWLIESADHASSDVEAPLPLFLRSTAVTVEFEDSVLRQMSVAQIRRRGAVIVLDGLDEAGERAATLTQQVTDFVIRWPNCRVVVSSRVEDASGNSEKIEVPPLGDEDASALMSAVGDVGHATSLESLSDDVRDAVHRPLFALFAALAPRTATRYDLIGEIARAARAERPSAPLRDLAIAIVKNGGSIEIREVPEAAHWHAEDIDRFVSIVDGVARFQLPIFLQWFASQGILDGTIPDKEFVSSLENFARWRYVLALALSGGSERRVDEVLAAVQTWNPGAAGWLLKETRHSARDSESVVGLDANALAVRVSKVLQSLQSRDSRILDGKFADGAVAVAVAVNEAWVSVQWHERQAEEGAVGTFIPYGSDLQNQYLWIRTHSTQSMRAMSPWHWVADQFAAQWKDALAAPHLLVPRTSIIWEEFRHRAWGELSQNGTRDWVSFIRDHIDPDISTFKIGQIIIERTTLDELLADETRWSKYGPWADGDIPWDRVKSNWVGANYSPTALIARVQNVLEGALEAYLDLTDNAFATFGDSMSHRARLPGEWHNRVAEAGEWMPAISEWFVPSPTRAPGLRANRVHVALADTNDGTQFDDQAIEEMLRAYERREINEPESQFAISAHWSESILDIFGYRAATKLALKWIADDLTFVGRLPDARLHDLR